MSDTTNETAAETPAEIAARGVAEIFNAIMTTPDALISNGFGTVNIQPLFDRVGAAVEAIDVRDYGPIPDHGASRFESIGRETGYLIGVQVGLRLRAAGGAR